MKQYRDLALRVLERGELVETRTGIHALTTWNCNAEFDLSSGIIPLVSLKHLPVKSVVGELVGFIHGKQSAADFRAYGSKVWDANANDPGMTPNPWLDNAFRKGADDLGRIYGAQWRGWRTITQTINAAQAALMRAMGRTPITPDEDPNKPIYWTGEIDQLKELIHTLRTDPKSRRKIVTAWNPGEFEQMALPPCHILFDCNVSHGGTRLNLFMYQRSADLFLGIPFNIASYALFLSLLAHLTGLKPGRLNITFGDTHIYMNHYNQVKEMLERTSLHDSGESQPTVSFPEDLTDLDQVTPASFIIDGYKGHPAIRGEMAV